MGFLVAWRVARVVFFSISMALVGCHAKRVPFSSDLKMSDNSSTRQLIAGFHGLENHQWRWTARRFAVVLQPPPGSQRTGATLTLKFYIPDLQIHKLGPMTVTADVGDTSLKSETFTKGGMFSYSRDIPPALFGENLLAVLFSFDKALAPTDGDSRELGAVVTEVLLEPRSR